MGKLVKCHLCHKNAIGPNKYEPDSLENNCHGACVEKAIRENRSLHDRVRELTRKVASLKDKASRLSESILVTDPRNDVET